MLLSTWNMLLNDYNTVICFVRNVKCCTKLDNIWKSMYFSNPSEPRVDHLLGIKPQLLSPDKNDIWLWVSPMLWMVIELRFNQHTGEWSRLRSAAHMKWNVLDNTITATPLILITWGLCLNDLGWHREVAPSRDSYSVQWLELITGLSSPVIRTNHWTEYVKHTIISFVLSCILVSANTHVNHWSK